MKSSFHSGMGPPKANLVLAMHAKMPGKLSLLIMLTAGSNDTKHPSIILLTVVSTSIPGRLAGRIRRCYNAQSSLRFHLLSFSAQSNGNHLWQLLK